MQLRGARATGAAFVFPAVAAAPERPLGTPLGVNQAECLACHKPLENVSYTFTLKQLAAAK
jgi:hypothetical protein